MKTLKTLSTLFALLAIFSTEAFAQTFEIEATAQVLSAVTSTDLGESANLEFGNVTQEVVKSVDKTTEAAGQWHFTGTADAEVLLEFDLPTELTGTGSSSNTLPISFSATDAGWNNDGTIGTQNAFNPNSVFSGASIGSAANNDLYVYLGGTVDPETANADSYTGTVSLTISYQ